MRKRVKLTAPVTMLAFIAVLSILPGSALAAEEYDAYDDFEGEQGANGAWYYLQYDGSSYDDLTYCETSHLEYPAWLGTDGDLNWLPAISKEFAAVYYEEFGDVLIMHPGDNSSRHDVVLRWKAPWSGTASVSISVQKGDAVTLPDRNGYDVIIEQNGEYLDGVGIDAGDGDEHVFSFSVSVEEGDAIDLRIYNRVSNGGDAALVKFHVAAEDSDPPSVVIGASEQTASAPNHKMVTIDPKLDVSDDEDDDPSVSITISSNEADDGLGDGDTAGDIELVMKSGTTSSSGSGSASLTWTGKWSEFESGFKELRLRSERSGSGSGRTYTIVVTATDSASNVGKASADLLVVPKSKGK